MASVQVTSAVSCYFFLGWIDGCRAKLAGSRCRARLEGGGGDEAVEESAARGEAVWGDEVEDEEEEKKRTGATEMDGER